MIRSSIKPGTTVWHIEFGIGKVLGMKAGDPNTAIVCLEGGRFYVPRKELTEIESEGELKC